jgi:8-oxo-dGTP diphosphatase
MGRDSADIVILRKSNDTTEVLLMKRKKEPYMGMYAIPGGKLEEGESYLEGAKRELFEETGLKNIELKAIGEYDCDGVHSTAFVGLVNSEVKLMGNHESEKFVWINVNDLPKLAANHNEKVIDGQKSIF